MENKRHDYNSKEEEEEEKRGEKEDGHCEAWQEEMQREMDRERACGGVDHDCWDYVLEQEKLGIHYLESINKWYDHVMFEIMEKNNADGTNTPE